MQRRGQQNDPSRCFLCPAAAGTGPPPSANHTPPGRRTGHIICVYGRKRVLRRTLQIFHVRFNVIRNLEQTETMSPSAALASKSYSIASIPAVSA